MTVRFLADEYKQETGHRPRGKGVYFFRFEDTAANLFCCEWDRGVWVEYGRFRGCKRAVRKRIEQIVKEKGIAVQEVRVAILSRGGECSG